MRMNWDFGRIVYETQQVEIILPIEAIVKKFQISSVNSQFRYGFTMNLSHVSMVVPKEQGEMHILSLLC